jgi:hypothetical protein
MKYIEVTAWGNNKKHLIPLNKIVDFNFDIKYSSITFISGQTLNIIEDESIIKGMLEYHGMNLVDVDKLDEIAAQQEAWNDYGHGLTMADPDELPF